MSFKAQTKMEKYYEKLENHNYDLVISVYGCRSYTPQDMRLIEAFILATFDNEEGDVQHIDFNLRVNQGSIANKFLEMQDEYLRKEGLL